MNCDYCTCHLICFLQRKSTGSNQGAVFKEDSFAMISAYACILPVSEIVKP